LNAKKLLTLILFFGAGLAVGLIFGNFSAEHSGSGEHKQLREHLEQVNRDLASAINSQREAAQRATKLQEELYGITDYARRIEAGTGRAEERAGSLTQRLDRIIDQSGVLADGINSASGSLAESRILIDELGIILRSVPGGNRKENQEP